MGNRIKIVLASVYHVSQYYGGNEHYFHNLALGLHEAGHKVTYLTSFAKEGVHCPYEIKIIKVGTLLDKPLPSLAWTDAVVGEKPDIFHGAGSGLPLMTCAWSLKHVYQIPTVLTFQAPLHPDNLLMKLAGYGETFISGRAFDAVIATGPYNEKMLKSWWPWTKVAMIPMMLAEHFFRDLPKASDVRKKLKLTPDRPTALFVGQLDTHHYYKGVDYLLEAVAKLPEEYQIIIIGEGNTRAEYEDKAKQLRISDKIIFAGFVKNELIRDYMVASDVFVLPSTSDSEGFGLVLLEAMSCQIPVITTTAIGSASWLKKENIAMLIPPSDSIALAKAILKQAEHSDQKQIIKAKQFALSLTKERMVDETVRLYREVIAKK